MFRGPRDSSDRCSWTTKPDVDPLCDAPGSDDAALAPVIPMSAAARHRTDGDRPAGLDPDAVGRDGALLGRIYGDRWAELPSRLGRVAAGLERLLEQGPMAVDPAQALPESVLANAWLVVRAATVHAGVLDEEAEVLGEALGVPLSGFPLEQVGRIAKAVIALGEAGGGEPTWADPLVAERARLVLDAHGADLREASALHREVYERCTERVWDIRPARLRAGSRRWRVIGQVLLRSDLAAVRRADAPRSSVREMADLISRAAVARQRVIDLAPLLERHLGQRWRGPLTQLVPIVRSQDAVRQLQRALGDHLDVDRLAALLIADAFATDELTQPAKRLAQGLQDWENELAGLCSGNPHALPANELARWAVETGAALGQMSNVLVDMAAHDDVPMPLRDLVDVLLLREHADEQAGEPPANPVAPPATQSKNASAS